MDLKYKFFLFLVIYSNLLSNSYFDDRGFIIKVGDIAPNFTTTLTTGERIKLSDLKGSVVILQFTASWCSVCRIEMPHLEKDIWKKYKNENLILIGIDRDEPLKTVINFKKEMGTTYPIGLDPGAKIFSLYAEKNSGVTRNVVIDQSGKIVFLTRLFDKEEYQKMIKKIKSIL